MRLLRGIVFGSILGSLCFAGTIAVTPGTGGYENNAYNYNSTFGWQFTLSSPLTVTALGYFDANGSAGLSDSYPVGIWDSTGTLLVSATVPSGPAATLIDGFSFISVTPAVLGSGTYVIGAYANSTSPDNFLFGVSGSSTVAGLTLGGAGQTSGNSLTEPTDFAGFGYATQGFFGPDFLVSQSTPEPATGALCVGALGLLSLLLRRRHA